jgi:uncharacterized membrane protein
MEYMMPYGIQRQQIPDMVTKDSLIMFALLFIFYLYTNIAAFIYLFIFFFGYTKMATISTFITNSLEV